MKVFTTLRSIEHVLSKKADTQNTFLTTTHCFDGIVISLIVCKPPAGVTRADTVKKFY